MDRPVVRPSARARSTSADWTRRPSRRTLSAMASRAFIFGETGAANPSART